MKLPTTILALIALMLTPSVTALTACITGDFALCAPPTPLPSPPGVPGPVNVPALLRQHQVCVSYNEDETCAGYSIDGSPAQPGADALYVCWTGTPWACRTLTLVGSHEFCVRWDSYAPSCLQVEG